MRGRAKLRPITETCVQRPDVLSGGMSDSQRYKMCGNGVVVSVCKWLAQNIVNVVSKGERIAKEEASTQAAD